MTLKFRHLMAFVAVVAVGLSLCLGLESGSAALWVGGFPLEVSLEDRSGRSIVAVAAQPVARVEAEHFLANPESPELQLEEVDWIAGQAFTVRVRCTGSTSRVGRDLSYHQPQALLVRIDYADGTNRFLSVKIPDGRVRRRVSVLVP
jgi:hypothetical protein